MYRYRRFGMEEVSLDDFTDALASEEKRRRLEAETRVAPGREAEEAER